ncbi:hypothetical protein MBLNU459_g7126t1 [Dothideomycetes sp. NU459]
MAGDIGDHFRDVRETRRKRKRISDQHSPSGAAPSRGRQHQRKTSLNNRAFSINTRQRPDHLRSAPPAADPRPRCYDWMVQKHGVHFARNRASFAEYTRVDVQLDNGMWVQGVGSVHLDILKGADADDGVDSIVLSDVLHVPNAICNGISMAMFDRSTVSFSPIFGCRDRAGNLVWMVNDFCGLHKLALLGHPRGESPLQAAAHRGHIELPGSLNLLLSERDMDCIKEALQPVPHQSMGIRGRD